MGIPDLLLPDLLAPLISETIFTSKIHHAMSVGSTNAVALEAGASGYPEGSVFLAEEQTAGRGRGGHVWYSEQSQGIYCSVLLRPQLPPDQVLLLSLAAGLAVRSAVEDITGLQADLKWPNDLLLGGKKFCGILTELQWDGTRARHAVIGMGLNVNHASFPDPLRDEATSLYLESKIVQSRVQIAGALLKSLDREYAALRTELDAQESILRRFQKHSSWTRGCAVRVEENGSFTGTTEGLDARGFLLVRTPQGLQTVVSGTVRRRAQREM
jgi:BirA family biotin operon repressor/biotin-[acetyl-CoA-carboxylase] ligase